MSSIFPSLSDRDTFYVLQNALAILRHKEKYYSAFNPWRKRRNQMDLLEILIASGEKVGIKEHVMLDFSDELHDYLSEPLFFNYFDIDIYQGITRKKAIAALNYIVNCIRENNLNAVAAIGKKPKTTSLKTRKLRI